MTANPVQVSLSQQFAASTTWRRRSVPPSLPEPLSQSLHQRWRERPRCSALRVAPASGDGVVHAIVGRASCRCRRARVVQDERALRVHVIMHGYAGTMRGRIGEKSVRAHRRGSRPEHQVSDRFGHRTIARVMLAPSSASSMLVSWACFFQRTKRQPHARMVTTRTPSRGSAHTRPHHKCAPAPSRVRCLVPCSASSRRGRHCASSGYTSESPGIRRVRSSSCSFYPSALAQRTQRFTKLRRVEGRRIDPPHTARDGLRARDDAALEQQAGVRGTDPEVRGRALRGQPGGLRGITGRQIPADCAARARASASSDCRCRCASRGD